MSNPLSEFEARLIIELWRQPNAPDLDEILMTFVTQRQWNEAEARASIMVLEI